MHNTLKAGIVLAAALTLTACSAPLDTNYTGDAVIESAIGTKRNCTITITAADGSQKSLITPSAFDCYKLVKGSSVKVVNGKVQ